MRLEKGNVIAYVANLPVGAKVMVPHVVNDANAMGSGVAKALYDQWSDVKTEYHKWFKEGRRIVNTTGEPKLGNCQFVAAHENAIICNMIGQSSPGGRDIKIGEDVIHLPPIRYQSLEECMYLVLREMRRIGWTKIVTVKFGCGLAGGSWTSVSALIEEIWENNGLDVTVYEP